jgi:nitric oxide reductase NorD protein
MDTTELFGLRIARFAERVRLRREAPAPGAVRGERLAIRLKLLAGLVAGRPLEVRLVPETGGWSGTTLLLPSVIDAFGTSALNEAAYVYRTAYAATSLRLRLQAAAPSPAEGFCRTLLAVAATRRALADSPLGALPNASVLADRLAPLLLARRPPLARIDDAAEICEALCRLRLGADRHSLPTPSADARCWLDQALQFESDDSHAITAFADALFDALPPPHRWGRTAPAPPPVPLWGVLLPPASAHPRAADDPPEPAQTVTRQLDPRRTLGRVERDIDRDRPRRPLFHHFEKIEALQDHDGDATRADESGDPEQEQAALDQLRPRRLIRTSQSSAASYLLDAMLDGPGLQVDGADDGTALYHYREWHHRRRRYRPDWCALQESAAAEPSAAAVARARAVISRHRRRIEDIRRRLEALLLRRSRQFRRLDGPELDLDAAVDRVATLAAGHTGEDRLYIAEPRALPDLAVYMLLDQSLSSDSWISVPGDADGPGVRILNVERDTVLLLGEALRGLIDRVGIACFSSNTRNRCRFVRIKGLDEPWRHAGARIMAVEPAGYTRIGPAIRHAAAKLARADARRRLLLLVSDGRPTDYDQYEGRYGIKDVAQAVREAHADGIVCHALAVETGTEARLTEMFGRGRFRVLHDPRRLPEAVSEILLRLRA